MFQQSHRFLLSRASLAQSPSPYLMCQQKKGLGGHGRLPARGSRSPVRACINAYGSSDHGLAALGSHMCHPIALESRPWTGVLSVTLALTRS
jgi:hypothetical protein